MKQKKFILQESELPTQWYNIQADMVNKPLPPLNPGTHEPLKPEDLFPIFNEECSRQELDQEHAWIDIPEGSTASIAPPLWCVPMNWKKHSTLQHIFTSRTRVPTHWARTR